MQAPLNTHDNLRIAPALAGLLSAAKVPAGAQLGTDQRISPKGPLRPGSASRNFAVLNYYKTDNLGTTGESLQSGEFIPDDSLGLNRGVHLLTDDLHRAYQLLHVNRWMVAWIQAGKDVRLWSSFSSMYHVYQINYVWK